MKEKRVAAQMEQPLKTIKINKPNAENQSVHFVFLHPLMSLEIGVPQLHDLMVACAKDLVREVFEHIQ